LIYFVAENPVPRALPETICHAVNHTASAIKMMENRNVGMLDLVYWNLFLIRLARISF